LGDLDSRDLTGSKLSPEFRSRELGEQTR
jgi:hypothetical protein